MQIVLAKVEMTGLKATGRNIMRDRNYFPEYVPAPETKACMWLNNGTAEDVKKAKAFAKTEGYMVFTFNGEKNPLAVARMLVMERFNNSEFSGNKR